MHLKTQTTNPYTYNYSHVSRTSHTPPPRRAYTMLLPLPAPNTGGNLWNKQMLQRIERSHRWGRKHASTQTVKLPDNMRQRTAGSRAEALRTKFQTGGRNLQARRKRKGEGTAKANVADESKTTPETANITAEHLIDRLQARYESYACIYAGEKVESAAEAWSGMWNEKTTTLSHTKGPEIAKTGRRTSMRSH